MKFIRPLLGIVVVIAAAGFFLVTVFRVDIAKVLSAGVNYVASTGDTISGYATGQTTTRISWSASTVCSTCTQTLYRNSVEIAYPAPGTSSYDDSGLSCGTSYSYQACSGAYGCTNTASVTTGACTPGGFTLNTPTKPLNVSGASEIDLSWTSASGATGYYVYRNVNGGAYSQVGSTGGTTYADTGLSCGGGTNYGYYIVAYNSGGSTQSNTLSNITTRACTPLPSGVSSSNNGGTLKTLWTPGSPITGQSIYRNGNWLTTMSASANAYGDNSPLTCGNLYSYGIQSQDGNGTSRILDGNSIYLLCAPSSITAAPTSQTAISLSWSAVANASLYYIYTSAGAFVANTTLTNYSVSGLTPNTTYSYYVVPFDNVGGNGPPSANASATTDQPTPGTPTIGTATALTQTSANVTWTRNAPLDETGFEIHSSGGPLRGTAGAGATSGTATGLTPNTPYAFYVDAYVYTNGRYYYSSNSANSNVITTDQDTPGTPTAVSFSGTGTGQTTGSAGWTAGSPTTQSGFNVYVYNASTAALAAQTTAVAGATSAPVSGLACGTSYYAIVNAYVTTNGRTYTSSNSTQSANASTSACDTTPPTIAFSPTSIAWTPNPLVTVTASDTSGVAYVRHCWTTAASCDMATTTASTFTNGSQLSPSGDGAWNLCIRAEDTIGNWSASPVCSGLYQRDATAPSVSANNSSSGWYGSSPTITLSASDSGGSGWNYSKYLWDSASCSASGTSYANGATITIPSDGTHTLYLCGADNAGNTNTWNGPYNLDTTAPSPNPPTVSASASSQTGISVTMSAGSDGSSGLHATPYGYSTDGATYTWYSSSSQTLSGSCGSTYTVYGKIRDAVGNMTSAGTASVTLDACTPGTPSAVTGSATGQNTATAGWTRNAPLDETNFNLTTTPVTATYNPGAGATTFNGVTGLTCSTSYTISIQAYVYTNTRYYYSSTGTSGAFSTNPCVSAPSSPTNVSAPPPSGTPGTTATWSGSASGYLVYLKPATGAYQLVGNTAGTSVQVNNIKCPSLNILYFFGYNTDTSLNNSVDASCSQLQSVDASNATNKKCAPQVTQNLRVDYCARGFFLGN